MQAVPDKIIDLKSEYCQNCGASLSGSTYTLRAKRQVVEIPPILPIYEEYRQYSCTCRECQAGSRFSTWVLIALFNMAVRWSRLYLIFLCINIFHLCVFKTCLLKYFLCSFRREQ
ncbi:MAG: IS66 family transposase zinc-finger binding domain-containing protein [Sphingobacteriales bacterium]|nr:IS66 family transposase zinc-finger binding domain-containing protein [Sphingobacteriales bacterium]MBP9141570.1 IS66 family transposase zinc-finger binding domain-containing protein [Chitinophagales bacterium]MBK6889817.1 IS66 family transposase zinc-finger binding domain-containing protein [Sphingobacteriales bacterium]MBK7527665.1 IS66 family transposase zinc-finger binding domain-containing protein [Sphingobacteriales bacterium]MBK8678656.1 IS66 family transposase zinc-finger binding dom